MWRGWLTLVLVVLGGCNDDRRGAAGSSAPACAEAARNLDAIYYGDTVTPETVEGHTRMCEAESWSGELRSCLAAAKTKEDLYRCVPDQNGGGKRHGSRFLQGMMYGG